MDRMHSTKRREFPVNHHHPACCGAGARSRAMGAPLTCVCESRVYTKAAADSRFGRCSGSCPAKSRLTRSSSRAVLTGTSSRRSRGDRHEAGPHHPGGEVDEPVTAPLPPRVRPTRSPATGTFGRTYRGGRPSKPQTSWRTGPAGSSVGAAGGRAGRKRRLVRGGWQTLHCPPCGNLLPGGAIPRAAGPAHAAASLGSWRTNGKRRTQAFCTIRPPVCNLIMIVHSLRALGR
jgi:hypothetical protein